VVIESCALAIGLCAQKVIANCLISAFGGSEVRCIRCESINHVAGVISNSGIWVHGAVIEDLGDDFHGVSGAMGLLGGNCASVRRVLSTALA